jgi:ribosomal protein S18 acetylase RimI-like enzyme
MAELGNMAGDGLPLYWWTKSAGPGEDPWDIGRQRAKRNNGSFSYRNTIVREERGKIAAALIGYPLPDRPEPIDYEELPAIVVPLQQLEDLVPGTWYVNVLATYPEQRGKGYGTELLKIAERLAFDSKRRGMSIVVSDANVGARRLYERCGYAQQATRPMRKNGWRNPGSSWVLLVRTFDRRHKGAGRVMI